MDTDETPIENPTKHSIKLAKEAHRRLDNGLQSFKKIRVQFFSALGVIISLSSVVIWRTSAVVKELEFTNRRLDRIETTLYRRETAMMETCAGCNKQTEKGLINIEVNNGHLAKSNCEYCADPNDYRTPQAWKGNSISETTVIHGEVPATPEEPITSGPRTVIDSVVQISHELNEAEIRNPGFIRVYSDQKRHEIEEAAKKEAEKKVEEGSGLPPELERMRKAHEERLKAIKNAQDANGEDDVNLSPESVEEPVS